MAFPVIVFQVNLALPTSEAMGPLTNQSMQGTLHPDKTVNQDHQVLAATLLANRPATRSWFGRPGGYTFNLSDLNAVSNGKNGDIIVLQGSQAVYAKRMFCSATSGPATAFSPAGQATYDRAVLTVLTEQATWPGVA